MARHESQRLKVLAKQLRSSLGAILMTDSMKSITANPLGEPLIWSRLDGGRFRHPAVKTRVKHGHLRHGTECLFDDLDAFQLGAIVERRKD